MILKILHLTTLATRARPAKILAQDMLQIILKKIKKNSCYYQKKVGYYLA